MIDVWLADLDVPPATAWALLDLLDDDERARAERFRFDHLHRRFVVAHAMLRLLLGDVRLAVGAHGKPVSADGRGPHFNLSHSGERAVVALREDAPVGVDVEQLRTVARLDRMAERVMSPAELAGFRRAADPNRFFLEVWVGKESVLKATGEGVTRPLADLDVATCGLRVLPIDVGDGYVGAVASEGDRWAVDVRTWTPP